MFDNKNRTRHYGLRIGDIVKSDGQLKQFTGTGKVVEFDGFDNNSACIQVGDKRITCVAEWLTIVTKVEDRVLYIMKAQLDLPPHKIEYFIRLKEYVKGIWGVLHAYGIEFSEENHEMLVELVQTILEGPDLEREWSKEEYENFVLYTE